MLWGSTASIRRFVQSTPRRSFLLYPLVVLGYESCRRGRIVWPRLWSLPLLAWGFLQYRLTREYRQRLEAGSVGMEKPPDRLLQSGPYVYTRNPMYLGHLIFQLGLALGFRSALGWLILLVNIPWFHARVKEDEARLREKFGAEYEQYAARVHRWIPGLL